MTAAVQRGPVGGRSDSSSSSMTSQQCHQAPTSILLAVCMQQKKQLSYHQIPSLHKDQQQPLRQLLSLWQVRPWWWTLRYNFPARFAAKRCMERLLPVPSCSTRSTWSRSSRQLHAQREAHLVTAGNGIRRAVRAPYTRNVGL